MDETRLTVQGADGFDLAALVEATKWHTAAPWSVPHFADSDARCECGYVFAREDAKTVCEVNYHDLRDKDDEHLPRPEAAANAHLIAAAPALLAHAQAQARRIAELEAKVVEAESGDLMVKMASSYKRQIEERDVELARLREANGRLLEAARDMYHTLGERCYMPLWRRQNPSEAQWQKWAEVIVPAAEAPKEGEAHHGQG